MTVKENYPSRKEEVSVPFRGSCSEIPAREEG